MLVPCEWIEKDNNTYWLKVGTSVIAKVWKFDVRGHRSWLDHDDMHLSYKTKEDAMRAVEARLGVRRG